MSLSANAKLPIRTGSNFGYNVEAGKHVYAGSILGFAADGGVQPVSYGTTLTYAGVSDRELDNSAGSGLSAGFVVAQRGIVAKVPVSASGGGTVTAQNIGQPVYAIDDASCTLSSTSISGTVTTTLLGVGTLAGIENGTWIAFK